MALVAKRTRAKDKIIPSRRMLTGILDGLKSQGKSIVLATGCFDLLHVGHVRCLEDAKSRGDFLVVAVHDDRSAGRIKGKGYPVNELVERMETLSGLGCVDYVTPLAEEDTGKLIEALSPSIFVRGSESTERSMVERNAIKAVGARAIACGDKKSHSTNKLVQKIRKRKFE